MLTSTTLSLKLRLPPEDWAVAGLLLLAVGVAAWRLPAVPELLGSLIIHGSLLFVFLSTIAAMVRWERASWVQLVWPAVTVSVIFTLLFHSRQAERNRDAYSASVRLLPFK